jgi:S1-C subfamily serine protease
MQVPLTHLMARNRKFLLGFLFVLIVISILLLKSNDSATKEFDRSRNEQQRPAVQLYANEIYSSNIDSLVFITVRRGVYSPKNEEDEKEKFSGSTGTGIVWSKDHEATYIVTNYHVVGKVF